jgi:hypothetical protein
MKNMKLKIKSWLASNSQIVFQKFNYFRQYIFHKYSVGSSDSLSASPKIEKNKELIDKFIIYNNQFGFVYENGIDNLNSFMTSFAHFVEDDLYDTDKRS